MKRKGLIKGLPALLLAAAMLSGCGNTTTTQANTPGGSGTPAAIETTGATDVSGNSGTTVAQAAELGTVQIAVKFPSFGKTGSVGKAIIDERTNWINVTVTNGTSGYYYQSFDLYPDPATGIATTSFELPAGIYFFYATAFDGSGFELENTVSAGEIVSGANSVVLTFATGDWQFVAADNTPTPLNLTDGAGNPVALSGFGLKPTWVFSGPPGPAKAAIDPTLPSGWADYGLGFFKTDGLQLGPVLWSDARQQFSAKTSTSSFSSGWLNLDDPARSDALFGMESDPLAGQRMAFIVENGLDIGGQNFSITDPVTGADLLPALEGVADSRFVDGKTMAGHFIEMTFDSMTETVLDPAADCNLFWSSSAATPAAARSAALAKAIAAANRVGKAVPGDVVTLAAAITVEMDECYGGNYSSIDGDGDGDFAEDWLTYDVDGDGLYDPVDGDTYYDYNYDGNYDYVVYPTQVDGDGDGQMDNEWLFVDKNYNGRFDPADGDQYEDYDLDGHFDYTYYPGTLAHRTEQFSDVKAREFRARAQQANTVYVDFGLPPTAAVIIQ